MAIVAGIFWILGWIPIVNFFTNAIYWMIWMGVFIVKYIPIIRTIAKESVSAGALGLKIGIIAGGAALLGMIPIVCWFPWQVTANVIINRMIKKLLEKIENIKKNADALKKGYKTMVRQPMNRRRMQQEEEGQAEPQVAT
jgi:hypothetical protein